MKSFLLGERSVSLSLSVSQYLNVSHISPLSLDTMQFAMISLLSDHERERQNTALTSALPTSRYTHWLTERDERQRENRKRTELEKDRVSEGQRPSHCDTEVAGSVRLNECERERATLLPPHVLLITPTPCVF